jgi:hypothetical protein
MGGKNPYTLLMECKLVQPLLKTVWRLFKKLKRDLPYDSTIPLFGMFSKESESSYNKDTFTPMFISALFTIAKLWKQKRFPTIGERNKKCGI